MSIVNKFLSEMPKIKKNSEELIEKVKIKSKKISDITKKANAAIEKLSNQEALDIQEKTNKLNEKAEIKSKKISDITKNANIVIEEISKQEEVEKQEETSKIENVEKQKKKEKPNKVSDAKKAASLVDEAVESGNYKDLNKQLSSLLKPGKLKDQYVFEPGKPIKIIIISIIAIIFLLRSIYYFFIGLGVIISSLSHFFNGLLISIFSAALVILNIIILIKMKETINFNKRYLKYIELLKYKNVELIENISDFSKVLTNNVVEDLKRSIKMKYIPQGHFSKNDVAFMVNDEIYNNYIEKQTIYDKYFNEKLDEVLRIRDRSDDIKKTLELGQEYISKINNYNTLIGDKDMTAKLDRIENVVKMIFHELDISPNKNSDLGLFTQYYLPTLEKLLDTYVNIDNKSVKGKNLNKSKQDIESAIEKMVVSFEQILDKFYEDQEMDIASEVETLETMMGK